MFKQGEDVYLFSGHGLWDRTELVTISRVTDTLAFVAQSDHREMKFDRQSGNERPRPKGYHNGARIERLSPSGDFRYRRFQRRDLARKLSFAATQYERGDDSQEQKIIEIYEAWRGFLEPSDASVRS